MNLYWLEQLQSQTPAGNDWLCAQELRRLGALTVPKRRDEWRLGRWTAKRAVSSVLDLPAAPDSLADIEIRAADSGAPVAFVDGNAAPVSISISHRAGVAVCVVGPPGAAVGCDVEVIEPRSDAFVADYFTPEEQSMLAGLAAADRQLAANLLWSAKESVLKALQEGLRLDTRSVQIESVAWPGDATTPSPSWHSLILRTAWPQFFLGWWRNSGPLVRTVVADPPARPPIMLALPPAKPAGRAEEPRPGLLAGD